MEPRKILIDTDMGSDCDDVGAFAVLHSFAKEGKAEILGCTHCASEISGAVALCAVNECYGAADIPVGRFTARPFLEEAICKRYTEPIMHRYLRTHEMPVFEDAVKTMRRILVNQTDVVLVTIGMFNNIAALLRSEADEISDKSGVELCRASVRCMYSMGGHFADAAYSEYNIRQDIDSARYVAEHFPMPITYIGFECGDKILTGKYLAERAEDDPMKFAYSFYDGLRESWDPITVYCAVNPHSPLFARHENVTVSFDEQGRTAVKCGGKDCYLSLAAPLGEIQEEIDRRMR